MGDPGLPLTTGEGNTAAMRERAERVLNYVPRDGDDENWSDVFVENLARDVVALTEELFGLREQLDAARQALAVIATRQYASAADARKMRDAARAALGVVGGRAEDLVSGASAAPDGEAEA